MQPTRTGVFSPRRQERQELATSNIERPGTPASWFGVCRVVAAKQLAGARSTPETQPAVAATQPAQASAPVVKDGLELTVAPAKAVFPPGELRFAVNLRNTSDKIIRLYEQKQQWVLAEPTVFIRDRKEPKRIFFMRPTPSGKEVLFVLRSLKPGESIHMELASDRVTDDSGREDKPRPWRVHFVGPLPAGEYEVTVDLRLVDFAAIRQTLAEPALPEQADVWSGQITSAPARFSVADPAAAATEPLRPAETGGVKGQAVCVGIERFGRSGRIEQLPVLRRRIRPGRRLPQARHGMTDSGLCRATPATAAP